MAEQVQRFFIPTKSTLFEGFCAFRSYLEKVAESQGKSLGDGWYPEKYPEKWADRPEVLKMFGLLPETDEGFPKE